MSRLKLKHGGKARKKALFGADGAAMAAATMAAAGMQVAATTAAAGINAAATANAAKAQSKSIIDSAKTNAEVIKQQTSNNTNLQKESIDFTRQQNQENRQQQQDIQLTLQMLAGQSNMNDRLEANKVELKYGGKINNNKQALSYGGGNLPFKVTDGGGVKPLEIDENGYGLYEIFGNDHEHYHKTSEGENKTGVGFKFKNGSVVEGEGNQNTNKGELLYVDPKDAIFISKHSIKGYNPREAVMMGEDPIVAYNTQEIIKDISGINDDGSTKNMNKRRKLKAFYGGQTVLNNDSNITQLPSNNTGNVANGIAYLVNDKNSSPVAKCGKRISIKRCGGRTKALAGLNVNYYNGAIPNIERNPSYVRTTNRNINSFVRNNTYSKFGSFMDNYGGALISGIGETIGAGLSVLANNAASRRLSKAYGEAGDIIADAYSKMTGIDYDEIKREDYAAPHTLAVIRDPNTNINPQLERIRRNAASERREVNRGTNSSAARMLRLAGIDDRMFQRMAEQFVYKNNADEAIKQGNAERITQTAQANADRDVQAMKDWTGQKLAVLQYNNDIKNAKLAGIGQANADAVNQIGIVKAQTAQNNLATIGNTLGTIGRSFASVYDGIRKTDNERSNLLIGADSRNQVDYLVQNPNVYGNRRRALNLYKDYMQNGNDKQKGYARELNAVYKFNI